MQDQFWVNDGGLQFVYRVRLFLTSSAQVVRKLPKKSTSLFFHKGFSLPGRGVPGEGVSGESRWAVSMPLTPPPYTSRPYPSTACTVYIPIPSTPASPGN